MDNAKPSIDGAWSRQGTKSMTEVGSSHTAPRNDLSGSYQLMDVFRALAAYLVVISHIRDLLIVDSPDALNIALSSKIYYFITGFGHSAVIIFFVLSGFWITKSVVRRSGEAAFWLEYLIDRLSRLWIVAIPAILLGGLLDIMGIFLFSLPIYTGATGSTSMPETAIESLNLATLVANVLFLQTFVSPALGSNGPLWSLAFEFWYYVWFPALWYSVKRRSLTLTLFALGVGLLNPEAYLGFLSWLCGSLLYFLISRFRWEGASLFLRRTILLSGVLAFAAAMAGARLRLGIWFDPVLSAAFSWLMLGICISKPAPTRWLNFIARYGARSSFSLYAIHFPLVAFIAGFFIRTGRLQPSILFVLTSFAMFLTVAIVAHAFSCLTEAKTYQLRSAARVIFGISEIQALP